jgi:ABC-type tungstate transport system permease subunit
MKKIIFTLMLLISLASFGASNKLLLATTTSVRDSGLLDYILPNFERESGIDVKFVAVGTGRALKMGEDGEVDALLVHAKTSELKFMKAGHGVWYISSGNGMAATLKIASEKGYYTLTDMSTYLHLKDKLNLDIKVDNDKNLINEYSIITINPDKNKMIHYENAKIFMNWITSKETKKLISTYGVEEFKMPLFIVE